MVWFAMAGIAAFAALAAIWPLLRGYSPSSVPDRPRTERAFYKAQLEEIERDVGRGLLPRSEAASARAEAARRLLAVNSDESKSVLRIPYARISVAAFVAFGVPLIAFLLYADLGRPRMADEPLAGRPSAIADKDVAGAVSRVEAHLLAKPDDGKGWAVLAPVYVRLGRYDDAVHAYSAALRLLGPDAPLLASYGEALVAAAGGVVTDKARVAFQKALASNPASPQARFYLALAAEQDGKAGDAIKAYESLVADAPPGAPWLASVQARLAALKGEPSPSGVSPVGTPDQAMIVGMVNRLATRLADKGGSIDEWGRLIRAYTVLHQTDKAKAAVADARKALAQNPSAVARLDEIARDLGLGEAN